MILSATVALTFATKSVGDAFLDGNHTQPALSACSSLLWSPRKRKQEGTCGFSTLGGDPTLGPLWATNKSALSSQTPLLLAVSPLPPP